MKNINQTSDEKVLELKNDFITVYERAKSIFKDEAFRFGKGLPINMILFETTLILVSELLNSSDETIKSAFDKLININRNFEDNSETPFEINIKYHRDSEENIKERMLWIKKIVGELND